MEGPNPSQIFSMLSITKRLYNFRHDARMWALPEINYRTAPHGTTTTFFSDGQNRPTFFSSFLRIYGLPWDVYFSAIVYTLA